MTELTQWLIALPIGIPLGIGGYWALMSGLRRVHTARARRGR